MAFATFADLLASAGDGPLSRAVVDRESFETRVPAADIRKRMEASLAVMKESAGEGLAGDARSRSGLIGGDAARIAASTAGPVGGAFARAMSIAVAIAEVNASMGRIVAVPTGGASGVVPGVLLALAEQSGASDEAVTDGLFVAAGFGAIMAVRTDLSGAAGGCQAETGAGAAMAAAAAVELLGGTGEQSGHAASLALQGLLGLVCDPVAGLVEVPCVARNATSVTVALAGVEMALAGVRFPVPFDEVADAMAHVGRSLPPSLRETARGGLAATPTGQRIAASGAGTTTGADAVGPTRT